VETPAFFVSGLRAQREATSRPRAISCSACRAGLSGALHRLLAGEPQTLRHVVRQAGLLLVQVSSDAAAEFGHAAFHSVLAGGVV